MINTSSNAVVAKAKAMYGKRLRKSDYQALLSKKTIPEIATYLKTQTYFSDCLKDINEGQIHRGRLEMLIRQDLYERYSKLIRYVNSDDEKGFYHYGVLGVEVQQILLCARMIKNNDNVQMIAKLPLYFGKNVAFDVNEIANVRTLADLLEVLRPTSYYEIVNPYLSVAIDRFDYTGLETALRTNYYQEVLKIVNDNKNVKNPKEINKIFDVRIELENITKIYRMKKYFHTTPEQIKEVITPIFSNISRHDLMKMIDEMDAQLFLEALSHGPYGKYINPNNFLFMEYHTKIITTNMFKRNIEFALDANMILLCYIELSETEIQNIVDIIEGVRYQVPVDRINGLLII